MQAALRAFLLAATLVFVGCTTSSAPGSSQPLPDGRDLSENPLDVTKLPQP
jgi:hypothetical protein